MCSSEKEKKKKKNPEIETWVAMREAWVSRSLGRVATRVQRGLGWLELAFPFLPLLLLLSLSLFSFFLRFCCFCILGLLSMNVCNYYFWVRNRVLETRFTGGRHVEKVSTQIRSEHENRPSKTRFIVQNRSSQSRNARKKYRSKKWG